MPRYKLIVEYDGTPFVGWQRQSNGRSVQEALEDAAGALCGAPTRVQGAGRTDTGVHAAGQVAHVDFERAWPADTVRDAVNAHLRPEPVAVLSAEAVPDTFDARHSAVRRHYAYVILNRRAPPALDKGVWHVAVPLDAAAMHVAAQRFVGRHDFTTFRAAQCQAASPVRTLDRFWVMREGERIVARCDARSFLHNQVRSMVGSLMQVGAGKWTADDVSEALRACDRARCGPVAPAAGLTLMQVDYPAG